MSADDNSGGGDETHKVTVEDRRRTFTSGVRFNYFGPSREYRQRGADGSPPEVRQRPPLEWLEVWKSEEIVERKTEFLVQQRGGEAPMPGHLQAAKGLFYFMIGGIFLLVLAFIAGGIGLVYLGASGNTELELFGLKVSSTSVGIVSIALGALALIVLYRTAMHRILQILQLPSER